MTDRQLDAVRAYIRLNQSVRAALADSGAPAPGALLPTVPMAEADSALDAAGLRGNEAEFFRMVRELHGRSFTHQEH
ncbi:hypothetical protein ACFQVC_09035 [Streptomyces monticola]|uniref:Uncharacterized protein n=1 Tax=Streptomyces monticola TaxID=2666263 RepID=A0ABW2JF55_9ACTN